MDLITLRSGPARMKRMRFKEIPKQAVAFGKTGSAEEREKAEARSMLGQQHVHYLYFHGNDHKR